MRTAEAIVEECREIFQDLDFRYVRAWKDRAPGRRALGYLPVYVPREVIHAAGALPVGVMGGGDGLEIIKGDAYFQSYICHLPRSFLELALDGKFRDFDGFLFPSICDVIRNLSGMWKMLFPRSWAKYFDLPQNFDPEVGGAFYRLEIEKLVRDLERMTGRACRNEDLLASIALYNRNRDLVAEIDERRSREPWRYPASEAYCVVRAGMTLEVSEHNVILRAYLDAAEAADRPFQDGSRVVVSGAFCEQPPLGLIKTLELAGCMIVDDDFLLGTRWHTRNLPEEGDGIDSLVRAYLEWSTTSSCRYDPEAEKRRALVEKVRRRRADGVIFCAPSFCDPSLLDLPLLLDETDKQGIPAAQFRYAENTGQFQAIREQAGTFADSLMLWSGR